MARPSITVHLLVTDGTRHTLQAPIGKSLMQAATAASIEAIAADCGGLMSCATCHVYVDDDWLPRLPPPSHDELSMLEMTAAPREPSSRLSCQIDLQAGLDGLCVRLPSHQY